MKTTTNFKKTCMTLAVAQAWSMGQVQAATIRVTTGSDELINGCTFRNAVRAINSGTTAGTNCSNLSSNLFGTNDTIEFDITSITLEDGQITIDDDDGNASTSVNVRINPNGDRVTIRPISSNAFRIFEINDSTVSFDNVEITGGRTSGSGGGIYTNDSTITLNHSTVSGNSAESFGAGIYSNAGTIALIDSTVLGNSSESFGGGFHNDSSTVTLENSTVSGNTAMSGGGFFCYSSTTTLENSTVSDNSAADVGGGIYSSAGSTTSLNNSTVTDNLAEINGGGINTNSSTVTLRNTIVVGNMRITSNGNRVYNDVANGIFELSVMNTSNSLFGHSNFNFDPTSNPSDNNLVVDLNNISLNSVLLPLADNGGPTLTHALPKGSPAIGAGDNANCSDVDQRGESRDAQCDIGAYEFQENVSSFFVIPLPNGKSAVIEL